MAYIHDAIELETYNVYRYYCIDSCYAFWYVECWLSFYSHWASWFFAEFAFGFLAVLAYIIGFYIVGLGIEIVAAQIRKEEVAEGYFVTGFLIPMIVPIDTPLWMVAVATAFAVIFAKEVFGGTGYNIFNVALITRAFLFFAYPTAMSGDAVWVRTRDAFWWGAGEAVDGFSGATPLGQIGVAETSTPAFHDIMGNPIGFWDAFIGWIPGSVGETSTLAILLGAIVLIVTGVASWKIMLSVFGGGAFMALIFNLWGPDTAIAHLPWYEHLVLGGFAFGAVFMATDPVTAARTETVNGFTDFYRVMAVIIRVLTGYPGVDVAILLMNVFGCLIDWFWCKRTLKTFET